jgi:hypothetical protein
MKNVGSTFYFKNAEEGEKYRSNISKKMLQHFAKC